MSFCGGIQTAYEHLTNSSGFIWTIPVGSEIKLSQFYLRTASLRELKNYFRVTDKEHLGSDFSRILRIFKYSDHSSRDFNCSLQLWACSASVNQMPDFCVWTLKKNKQKYSPFYKTIVARPSEERGSVGQCSTVTVTPTFWLPCSVCASQYLQHVMLEHCMHYAPLYPVPISFWSMRRVVQLKTH